MTAAATGILGPPEAARATTEAVVVLGLGNTLLSDDGAGIEALRLVARAEALPAGVRLVDGGTAGPDLLAAVAGCDRLLVLDAVDVGGDPGEVVRVEIDAGVGRTAPGTAHELGLETLLRDLTLLGESPRRAVLIGIQPGLLRPGTGLSPPVARGMRQLVSAALDELRAWAAAERTGRNGQRGRPRPTEDET